MKKIILNIQLIIVALMLLSAAPKPFRKTTIEERRAIKKYSRLINRDDGSYHILIMTEKGNMVIKLYNDTPLHRDNFISKVRKGFYDSLLFHRIINNFMIQGGDPNSKNASAGQPIGAGSAPGDRIASEFRLDKGIYHKRGAIAAARDNNPQMASSNCQFYIVQRPAWRPGQLDSAIVSRKLKLNDLQKELYTTTGGTPHLDGAYTVFGELEYGFDVLDQIAAVKTTTSDRPEKDIRMRMFLLNEVIVKK